ncbi:carboxypeptidase-like regulatory domain-containing protein [Kaarinaea lacus]
MRSIDIKNIKKCAVTIALSTALVACSSGGGGGGSPGGGGGGATTVNVSGTVSAPGGMVAFKQPSLMQQMFASFLGSPAHAAITGVTPVGAGVTVNLIEVDATGTQVGDVIASATTDATGAYSLDAPEGFTPGPQYVVRAEGSSTDLDARVIDLTADVDPLTDVASDIITDSVDDLSLLSTSEAEEIYTAVDSIAQDVEADGLSTTELTTALLSEATNNEDVSNIVGSTTAGGQICGNVTDSNGTALENIRIVVRDFGNWVTRAKTKTDASGDYCLNVPVTGDADPYITTRTLSGEYIIGALNFTGSSMAASQWWTSTSTNTGGSGGANNQFGADKITVADTTPLTKDFVLDANGARIEGTVTKSDTGGPVEGMRVLLRNYDTFKPLSTVRVKADGSYRINVKAGDYLLSYRNQTRQPYASEIYRAGTDGVNNRNMASRETMTAGNTHTYDVVLNPGVVISGIVTDEGATAIPGQVVSIENADGGRLERLRTNKEGKFRIMVNPRVGFTGVPYSVETRGQAQDADTNGGDDNTPTGFKLSQGSGFTFNAAVAQITGTLVSDADGTTPVSEAVLLLRGAIGSAYGNYQMRNLEVSNADGTFTLYSDTVSDFIVQVRMDSNNTYGSGTYVDTPSKAISATQFANGTPISVTSVPATIDLGTIRVPTLGTGNSVGYLVGDAGDGSAVVHICINGTTTCGGGNRLASTTARGDGSFKITLPVATYPVSNSGSLNYTRYNCETDVVISDGATTDLTFDLASTTQSCMVSP